MLHLILPLAAQEEVVALGLVGLRIDPHRTGPILGLPALERLDDLDWLGAFRPLDASQHQARHAIGRHGSIAGRQTKLLLVGFGELGGHRIRFV